MKMINKGKFTRFDLCKDGTAYLEFHYKKLFTNVSWKAKEMLEEWLMKDFMGAIDVKVTVKGKEIMIFLHLGYPTENNNEGMPFILWFEEQTEDLSRLCSNF